MMLHEAIERNRRRWARYRSAQSRYDRVCRFIDRGVNCRDYARADAIRDRLADILRPYWAMRVGRLLDRKARIGG